jgi:nickel-dependent lactate racemase
MNISFKYGKDVRNIVVPDSNVRKVLEPSGLSGLDDLEKAVESVLHEPTAGPSLDSIIREKAPSSVVIMVNDITRSTPTSIMIRPVLDLLHDLGTGRENITIIVATGTHRAMTDREIRNLLGEDIVDSYTVVNHDCDAPDMVTLGPLSTGNVFRVNRLVAEADLRIAIGEILLHFHAGFAGGRKSIFPGTTARDTVMRNHSMMIKPGAALGNIDNNPVSDEMIEALEKYCPLHFIVNCICNTHKEVVRVVGGHYIDAWKSGIETFRKMNFVSIPREEDVVMVSAGGYPKDINIYQAHKALEMACHAVRPGGTIVFFAELAEGWGHKVFQEWAVKGMTKEEVISEFSGNFIFGFHKLFYLARIASKAKVILVSDVSDEMASAIFATRVSDPSEAIKIIERDHGKDYGVYVIPQGGIVLPVVEKNLS